MSPPSTHQSGDSILVVDDEQYIRDLMCRWIRDAGYQCDTATNFDEVIQAFGKANYSLVFCDLHMPGKTGDAVMEWIADNHPQTAVVMATGDDDRKMAIRTLELGAFGYMIKPFEMNEVLISIDHALERRRLQIAERELLEKTVNGSIAMLADFLSMTHPDAMGKVSQISHLVRQLGTTLKVDNLWEIETAARLSLIGCVTIPAMLFEKVRNRMQLSVDEQQIVDMHSQVAADIIAKVPRLEQIAECVRYQNKNFDGTGFPFDDVEGEQIPFGARLLKVAIDYTNLDPSQTQPKDALDAMNRRAECYDPKVMTTFEAVLGLVPAPAERSVKVHQLAIGMVLVDDVLTPDGMLIARQGQDISSSLQHRIANIDRTSGVRQPIRVFVPGADEPASQSGER